MRFPAFGAAVPRTHFLREGCVRAARTVPLPADPSSPESQPEAELCRVRANGVGPNVATAGRGRAVLLLHGFPHTWRVRSRVIGELATRYRAIAPDLKGSGDSVRPGEGYGAGTWPATPRAYWRRSTSPPRQWCASTSAPPPAFLLAGHA